ncbi:MAG TPA: hypothetical protein DCM87_07110 [Planctomycetes bacterium]|nr:hypothetical protein [Planctomycetota bacterium]
MLRTAFVGLAALAAGAALGLLVWKERFAPPAPAPDRQEPLRPVIAGHPPAVEKAPEPLQARIESLCAAAPRAARGIITGTVVTEGGAPLADVHIVATPLQDTDGDQERLIAKGDTASQVLALVEAVRDARAWTREARTGARGRFAIGGLDARSYELRASAPGYECVCAYDEAPEPMACTKPGGDVAFIAIEMREVAVVLRLPDGAHPRQGTIRYRRGSGSRSAREPGPSIGWLPPRILLQLAFGQWAFTATAEQEGVTHEGATRVFIAGRAPLAPVEIELTPRFSIGGRVLVPDGEDGQVHVRLEERDDSDDPAGWVSHAGSQLCGADGSFAFSSLDPGTYRVSATRFLHGGEVKAVVELADRPAWVELTLPPLRRSDYVALWVVDPRGAPLIGSDVQVRGHTGYGVDERREDGSWRLFYDPDYSLEDEEYSASVTVRGYGRKSVSWKRPETCELVVRFEEPAMARIVLDAPPAQRGLARLKVALRASVGDGMLADEAHDFEGDAGECLLGPFAPGAYKLEVTAVLDDACQGELWRELSHSVVQLRSGMNAIQVAVPEFHRLLVAVDPSLECDALELWSLDAGITAEYTDVGEDGLAEFRALPPGNYRLVAPDLRVPGDMAVTIPGPAEVRFQPRTMNALRVRDAGGMLDGTPFRAGDTIVGIGGTRFADMNALLGLLALLEDSDEPVKANVVRGNEEIVVEVAPSALSGDYMMSLWPLSF